MIYINLVQYYLILSRSIRTGNFMIFKYILPKLSNLFFVFNLLKVSDTHPGLEEVFQKGHFGIR